MKILKYLLLLALLFFVTATIFVATLKPNFQIVKTKIINVPRNKVFDYINNLKNWQEFGFCEQNEQTVNYRFDKNFNDTNGTFSWKTNGVNGKVQTLSVLQNRQLKQLLNLNGEKFQMIWTFTDTLGKTKVSWETKGILSFENKMLYRLSGGIDNFIGNKCEKSLEIIDKNLDFEINKYNIKTVGYLQKTTCNYLHKTITSKNENLRKNIQILINEIVVFFDKKNITAVGSPFVIYNSKDTSLQTTNFSVCLATIKPINTFSSDGFLSGKLLPFQAIKSTLNGDYSHLAEVKQKTLKYFLKNNLAEDPTKPYVEVYLKSKKDIKNPSKWVTDIYVPAKLKTQYTAPKKSIDTLSGTPVEPQQPEISELPKP
jgi:hypothetical protein